MESFALLSISGAPAPGSARSSTPEPPCPPGPPGCTPGYPPGGELPARDCAVYRPWFSPYSYFVCTKAAARHDAGGRPASPAGSAQEPDEPDDLSETVCSSCSPDELRPPEGAQPARPAAGAWCGITVWDLLEASRWQLAPRDGYKCVACCRVFPTLCSLKTHVRHGAREGFSCKVYYRRLKALWEREREAREASDATAPL